MFVRRVLLGNITDEQQWKTRRRCLIHNSPIRLATRSPYSGNMPDSGVLDQTTESHRGHFLRFFSRTTTAIAYSTPPCSLKFHVKLCTHCWNFNRSCRCYIYAHPAHHHYFSAWFVSAFQRPCEVKWISASGLRNDNKWGQWVWTIAARDGLGAQVDWLDVRVSCRTRWTIAMTSPWRQHRKGDTIGRERF